MAFGGQPTREDRRIEENRGQMGVIFFRKKGEFRGLGSGSIVNLKGSNLFHNSEEIKWCLLTSDSYIPINDIREGDYFFEYWSSDLKTVQKQSLRKVAQSNVFYNPTPGLALIPVCPSWVSKLFKSSVLDKRRAFPTRYYYGPGESGSSENIQCFIVGSYECKKDSLTVERFTLITERDDQGRLQHCLRDDVDTSNLIFQSYDDIITSRSHLYPRGAMILKDDGPKATSIGILNFTEEGLISPVFFTPETFTGKVQLYYPTSTDVEEEALSVCPEGKIETNASQTDSAVHSQVTLSTTAPSQAPGPIVRGYENQPQVYSPAGAENQDGASLTNDGPIVYPDDYTLQCWQKLYKEVEDENIKLKQQSEHDQKMMSLLKDENAELHSHIKRTELLYEEVKDENTKLKQQSELSEEVKDENTKLKQQSEHDQKIISLLKDENAELRSDIKRTEQQNEELRAENEYLRKRYDNLRSRTEELRTKWEQLLEDDRDADYKALLTENEQLNTHIKALRDRNVKLLAENSELRKDWNAESEELREVNEDLRAQYDALKTKCKELLTENESLSAMVKEMADQFKELLNQPDSAVCGDDTSSIKDSNDVKAEEPSGSSANNLQRDSDGSRKEEEQFLDPLTEDVFDLD